ncbi:MAG: PLP-dependent transferase [Saprospiraceae bacterium]|nr:PLP-dependent transferase [Pyrinomonadaceae bacterium]
MSDLGFATQLVHAGERRAAPGGVPASTPIYASSSFVYQTMEEVDRIVDGEVSDFVYSRYGNPTVAAFEDAMAKIENGKFAVAFGSGMAALHAALLGCDLTPGAFVIASKDLYGATFDLLYTIFGSLGVKTVTADFGDLHSLNQKAIELKPSVFICETLSNPLLRICDIGAVSRIAREVCAKVIVDNTFATPFLCRPLDLGADFVVHSATKYLGGHADATGGVVIAREDFERPALLGALTLVGGVLSPWEAHSILGGLKTLGLRMEKQCANASLLAMYLELLPQIESVVYPEFFEDDTLDSVFHSPLFGAIVTIRLVEDTREAAYRFMNSLKVCTRAASVGDIFTGIVHPATATHRELSPAKRRELGITEGLIRISVGIEDINDIIVDIEQALQFSVSDKLPKVQCNLSFCTASRSDDLNLAVGFNPRSG